MLSAQAEEALSTLTSSLVGKPELEEAVRDPGTVYNVTTGRAFFDGTDNARDRIIAHMRREPFEDAERLPTYPVAIALLRAATSMTPAHRPSPVEFAREFAAGL